MKFLHYIVWVVWICTTTIVNMTCLIRRDDDPHLFLHSLLAKFVRLCSSANQSHPVCLFPARVCFINDGKADYTLTCINRIGMSYLCSRTLSEQSHVQLPFVDMKLYTCFLVFYINKPVHHEWRLETGSTLATSDCLLGWGASTVKCFPPLCFQIGRHLSRSSTIIHVMHHPSLSCV
jgi:hypothetical protein